MITFQPSVHGGERWRVASVRVSPILGGPCRARFFAAAFLGGGTDGRRPRWNSAFQWPLDTISWYM